MKGFAPIFIILGILVLIGVAGGAYFLGKSSFVPSNSSSPFPTMPPISGGKACTQEAKICPDGSSVGRTGPNCEFTECPSTKTDTAETWKTYTTDKFSLEYPSGWKVDTSFLNSGGGYQFNHPDFPEKQTGVQVVLRIGSPDLSGEYGLDKKEDRKWLGQKAILYRYKRESENLILSTTYGGVLYQLTLYSSLPEITKINEDTFFKMADSLEVN